jgi:uncharacterized protein YndB with AHSA1/START domain
MTTSDSDRELRLTRVYDAPLALVWDAFTLDAHAAQWWGPRGFTITTHHKDVRPGGMWDYTMHGPDGTDWPNFTRYLEVEPRARLVYDHGASSADAAPMFRVTAHFRDVDGRTELTLRMTFPSADAARNARVFIKAAGGNSTWDRLAEYLAQQHTHEEIFVVTRSFDAPIEPVFDAFTKPDRLTQWLPPTGFTMVFHRAHIAAGGDAFWSMTDGTVAMHGRFAYLTVERPHTLEYRQCFTDAEERIARHPGAPAWPETMQTRVQLTAEGPAQTRVTIRWSVAGVATAEEIAAFVAERGGMTQGWTGSFDTLEAVLAEAPSVA